MTDFELEGWYASEAGKRRFGSICQAVNEQGAKVYLLGSKEAPLLILADADKHRPQPDEIKITIDEAKADWPAVTTAAAIYGTRFRIKGRKHVRAVLYRHPSNRHPAEKYLRSSSADANHLAHQIEALAKEVRKLGMKLARLVTGQGDFDEVARRLNRAADIIDRRFREIWRIADGLPSRPIPSLQ
jgi:hypothetical protein